MNETMFPWEIFSAPITQRRPTTLREALCRLNMGVHPKDAVEKYKKTFRRKLLAKELFDCTVGLVGSLLGSAIFALFARLAWTKIQSAPASIITAGSFAVLCTGCLVMVLVYAVSGYLAHEMISWRSFDVVMREMKTEGVPGKIRRKAWKLYRNLPGATFSIEWCGADPFFVAKFRDESEYIGHWDEPEFVER